MSNINIANKAEGLRHLAAYAQQQLRDAAATGDEATLAVNVATRAQQITDQLELSSSERRGFIDEARVLLDKQFNVGHNLFPQAHNNVLQSLEQNYQQGFRTPAWKQFLLREPSHTFEAQIITTSDAVQQFRDLLRSNIMDAEWDSGVGTYFLAIDNIVGGMDGGVLTSQEIDELADVARSLRTHLIHKGVSNAAKPAFINGFVGVVDEMITHYRGQEGSSGAAHSIEVLLALRTELEEL